MAFDHNGDCGIYNSARSSIPHRRGLGTALTAPLLHDTRSRG
jgi:hypothetical protein